MKDTTTETSSLSTGDTDVDAALARLDQLEAADLEGHVEIYDDVQAALSGVLDDTVPGDPAPS